MHAKLIEHPVYKQAQAEVARIKGAQLRHQQETKQAELDYRDAEADYQRKAIEALRNGQPTPERPTKPEVDAALVQQLAYDTLDSSELLRAAERQVAPELLPELERRAFDIEEAIRQAADTMRSLAREASELRVTAAALRSASEFPPLVNAGAIDVGGLFDLVVHGDRLLTAESARPGGRDAGGWDSDSPRGSHRITSFSPLSGRR